MPRYTPLFKQQAVEKVLSKPEGKTVHEIASELSIGYSTLQKWISQSKRGELAVPASSESQESRPQDWSLAQRLDAVMDCHRLSEEEVGAYCRERGIYPHHLAAWKKAFTSKPAASSSTAETRQLKQDVKRLEGELNRKDKALSETAALLVLSKKCQALWSEKTDV